MAAQMLTITLYDVVSLLEEQTISPFVGKTRLLLTFKKIPFQTVWITFPEIESTCKTVGAPPTAQKKDGRPHYTVPFITVSPPAGSSDPVLAISDSWEIAKYIEKTFPDPTHPLIPDGTRIYRTILNQFMIEKIFLPMFPLIIEDFLGLITTGEWYASTREDLLGVPLQAILPKDEAGVVAAREKLWLGFEALAKALDEEEGGNYRIAKGQVTYAEMEVVAFLYFAKRVGPDVLWTPLKDRNGGKWKKLLEEYRLYLPVC